MDGLCGTGLGAGLEREAQGHFPTPVLDTRQPGPAPSLHSFLEPLLCLRLQRALDGKTMVLHCPPKTPGHRACSACPPSQAQGFPGARKEHRPGMSGKTWCKSQVLKSWPGCFISRRLSFLICEVGTGRAAATLVTTYLGITASNADHLENKHKKTPRYSDPACPA